MCGCWHKGKNNPIAGLNPRKAVGMKFSKLADYYEKLEATPKRLELVDILSRLFKEANADEIGKICYLIQGRVASFFEPI